MAGTPSRTVNYVPGHDQPWPPWPTPDKENKLKAAVNSAVTGSPLVEPAPLTGEQQKTMDEARAAGGTPMPFQPVAGPGTEQIMGPLPGTSGNPMSLAEMRASLRGGQGHRGRQLGRAAPPNAPKYEDIEPMIPPVLKDTSSNSPQARPELAVIGNDMEQLAAPRRQEFSGFEGQKGYVKPGDPMPVRSYSEDHPSPYQQQPLWPPAPPEPLFPLHSDDDAPTAQPIPPIPGQPARRR